MATQIDTHDLLDRMGGPVGPERWKAYGELEALGAEAASQLAIEMLSHPNWYVRRAAAIYADHHPDPALLERLKLALHDPKAKVRLFAVHSLSCEPCKPGGNPVDATPYLIRAMKEDKAPRVRRMAAVMLTLGAPEKRVVRAFRHVLEHEPDEKVRRWATMALDRMARTISPSPLEEGEGAGG